MSSRYRAPNLECREGAGQGDVDLISKLNSFDMIMIWILIWIMISIHPSMIGSIRPKYRRGMKVCSFRHVRFKWMDYGWTLQKYKGQRRCSYLMTLFPFSSSSYSLSLPQLKSDTLAWYCPYTIPLLASSDIHSRVIVLPSYSNPISICICICIHINPRSSKQKPSRFLV